MSKAPSVVILGEDQYHKMNNWIMHPVEPLELELGVCPPGVDPASGTVDYVWVRVLSVDDPRGDIDFWLNGVLVDDGRPVAMVGRQRDGEDMYWELFVLEHPGAVLDPTDEGSTSA